MELSMAASRQSMAAKPVRGSFTQPPSSEHESTVQTSPSSHAGAPEAHR